MSKKELTAKLINELQNRINFNGSLLEYINLFESDYNISFTWEEKDDILLRANTLWKSNIVRNTWA